MTRKKKVKPTLIALMLSFVLSNAETILTFDNAEFTGFITKTRLNGRWFAMCSSQTRFFIYGIPKGAGVQHPLLYYGILRSSTGHSWELELKGEMKPSEFDVYPKQSFPNRKWQKKVDTKAQIVEKLKEVNTSKCSLGVCEKKKRTGEERQWIFTFKDTKEMKQWLNVLNKLPELVQQSSTKHVIGSKEDSVGIASEIINPEAARLKALAETRDRAPSVHTIRGECISREDPRFIDMVEARNNVNIRAAETKAKSAQTIEGVSKTKDDLFEEVVL